MNMETNKHEHIKAIWYTISTSYASGRVCYGFRLQSAQEANQTRQINTGTKLYKSSVISWHWMRIGAGLEVMWWGCALRIMGVDISNSGSLLVFWKCHHFVLKGNALVSNTTQCKMIHGYVSYTAEDVRPERRWKTGTVRDGQVRTGSFFYSSYTQNRAVSTFLPWHSTSKKNHPVASHAAHINSGPDAFVRIRRHREEPQSFNKTLNVILSCDCIDVNI